MTTFGGPWTQEKLDILKGYLDAYTTALKNQPFRLIYVDAFAGEGLWRPGSEYAPDAYEEFSELLRGSAAIALEIDDRYFDRLLFIEKDTERSESLKTLAEGYQKPGRVIDIVNEDANVVLPQFCAEMGASDRAVVFLDPFATEVSWDTVAAIAATSKIDCWILFPLGAITRMMPVRNEPSEQLAIQLDRVFGGRGHWENLYRESAQQPLPLPLPGFADQPLQERPQGSHLIAVLYGKRLRSVFHRVAPTSRTLRNSRGAPLFELFFGATNPRGALIAVEIADYLLQNW